MKHNGLTLGVLGGMGPAATAEFYIDYRDFAGSRTGRCVPRADGIPPQVIDYTVTPEVFDCLVKTAE